MKKKLLFLLFIPLCLLAFTGCESKEKEKSEITNTKKSMVLEDEKLGFKTTFSYDIEEKYTDIEVDTNSGASAELEFKNETLGLEFQMYYNTMRTASYQNSKTIRSNQKFYKEYTFGDYEAYAYSEYEDKVYLNVLLKTEDNDMVDVLFISIEKLDYNNEKIVADLLDEDELQKFFQSIKFEKTR